MVFDHISMLEEKFRDKYMGFYRHLHRNPEPSYYEEKTAAYVAEALGTLPMDEIRAGIGGHGVLATLKGGKPGGVVALRADMDALNISEQTGCPFASENPGVMHACGHDSHTAMLLAVAHVLSEMKDEICGTVKFVFQPSEEMTPTGGAPGMIKDGVLDNPKVDAMIGLHVWPTLATGTMGVQAGAVSAASDHLKFTIRGKACHGSMPDAGVDAIVAASASVMALQAIISRNVSPREPVVITIGTIHGGDRYNIVPDCVELDGTVRSFNEEIHQKLPQWIARAVESTAAAYGASAEIDYQVGYPSTINDPKIVEICKSAAADVVPDGVLPPQPVPPTGEDFAFYSLKVPSAFAWLGCRPKGVSPEDMPALHNDKFLPDPSCFPYGVRYLSNAAIKLLSSLEK